MTAGLTRSLRASSLSLGALCLATLAVRAETPLERGTYLMQSIVACGNCHTPKDRDGKPIADRELAGGFVINAPIFHSVSPNITPDKETGIGNWTDDQIVDAIRNGKRPDGTIIGPPMPIQYYRSLSDSKIPLPAQYGPTVTGVLDMPRTDKVAYGRYLATALGHCMDCHTPMVNGRSDMTKVGAGGREFEVHGGGLITSTNLTPANDAGIARWSDAQVKDAIAQGVRPDRALVPLMAFEWYKNISPDDLDALVAYLRTLKPAMR
jgi:mono/diheme cytochrome c family protein